MADWKQIVDEAPDLASSVEQAFSSGKHSTLATLRKDGSPRISGTEVELRDGVMRIGSMPGAVKAQDLLRDPRFALHSPTSDPPADDPSSWRGEAKVAGRVVEEEREGPDAAHAFRLDLREVVHTRVVGEQLEIVSWHVGTGLRTRRRS